MDIINEKNVEMTFDEFCRGGKSDLSQVTGTVKVWTTSELEAAAELRRLQAENERLHQINQSHEMKLSVRGYKIQINDLKAMNAELLDALKDMHGGWKYIRETHGDLYGVGWDRAQKKAEAAIANSRREIMSIEAMKQALDALEIGYECVNDEAVQTLIRPRIYADVEQIADAITTLRAAIQQAEEPLIDSVRQMRDVQGMDGTWNCDPYMHGLYNGLEFAVSLLEQREPQFKDAPEKWLSDLPKPRIFSATEAAHGIGEKK